MTLGRRLSSGRKRDRWDRWIMVIHVLGCGCRDVAPLRYFTLRYSELAFCPSRGALSMTLV